MLEHTGIAPDTEATGVLLYQAGRVNVQNNNISIGGNAIDADYARGHVRP